MDNTFRSRKSVIIIRREAMNIKIIGSIKSYQTWVFTWMIQVILEIGKEDVKFLKFYPVIAELK